MFKVNSELLNKESFQKMLISMPGIVLAAEEADRFIDYVYDQSVLKNNARQIKMDKATKNIRAMGLGAGRFLHPAATFGSSDYKQQLSHNLIVLTAKEVRGCAVIHDDDIEDNIEGDAFIDHIMKMVTKQIANELDEAYWIGDTHGLSGFAATDIRGLFDGWRYRINHSGVGQDYLNNVSGSAIVLDATDGGTNAVPDKTKTFLIKGKIVEQASAAPYNWEFKFSKARRRMPAKYKLDGLANLRFFTNDQVEEDYIEALAERSTALGDTAILGQAEIKWGKIPIVSCPLMANTLDADGKLNGGNYTDCMLTHKDNLIIGIHRDIEMETERSAADKATYFFYSLRADLAIENVNAIVLIKKLTIG